MIKENDKRFPRIYRIDEWGALEWGDDDLQTFADKLIDYFDSFDVDDPKSGDLAVGDDSNGKTVVLQLSRFVSTRYNEQGRI